MRLYRQYQAISAAAEAHPSMDDDEVNRLFYDERDRVEDEMFAQPSLTAQDMAAKMLVAHCHGGFSCLDYDGTYWAEARQLVA